MSVPSLAITFDHFFKVILSSVKWEQTALRAIENTGEVPSTWLSIVSKEKMGQVLREGYPFLHRWRGGNISISNEA